MNDELAAKLEYWRTWNIPRNPAIREGASDGAARELAQLCTVEIAALAARVAAAEKDAARYRWLRKCDLDDVIFVTMGDYAPVWVDDPEAVIDAALSAADGEKS